jgi:PAS domain S-box-containing protein
MSREAPGNIEQIEREAHRSSYKLSSRPSANHIGQDSGPQTPEQEIDALKAENRSLKAEVKQLRQVVESATDYAIITLNLSGEVTGCNEGARQILGYSDSEILGRSGDVLFPAEDREKEVFLKEMCRAMEEGRAINERWHLRRDGSRFWASGSMMPLQDEEGHPVGFLNVLRDNTEARAQEERRALLMAEMGHRMKNLLATVQAVASQTLRDGKVPEAVQETLRSRLVALAGSHDLLTRGRWEGAPLAEILHRTLAPYSGSGHVQMDGMPVWLAADIVEMLNLAFHELATNAAKYGALSTPLGHVDIRWTLKRKGKSDRWVEILWRERGGPPVVPPERQGFGSRLLEQGLAQKSGGTVKLNFRREGLECHICIPAQADTARAA